MVEIALPSLVRKPMREGCNLQSCIGGKGFPRPGTSISMVMPLAAGSV